uniref:Ion_trans domain-containing protein n=1 Tax=Panagrellus redivivus TaxID=6233 RepID=A0A7E4ZSC8_PANRE
MYVNKPVQMDCQRWATTGGHAGSNSHAFPLFDKSLETECCQFHGLKLPASTAAPNTAANTALLIDVNKEEELTLDFCNANTYVYDDKVNDRIFYVFNYKKYERLLNYQTLKKLKDRNEWDVIKHPFVFNYINEVLLNAAWFYTTHIVTYFMFLLLLYSYIHTKPTVYNNSVVTALVSLFIMFMIIKSKLKTERDGLAISKWFCLSYSFAFFTYFATVAFVWTPMLFSYDDYHTEYKQAITWFMPIVAIIASWIQCLYVLRKSPCGPYVMMMSKILKSFTNTTIIWIPTLLCFAFAFQLVMRDSGTHPWDDPVISNSSSLFMTVLQSFTKTSAMMIGEVEANDILERRAWVANILLIFFEIITVILLMNLMISLAVGDVSDLRANAENKLLRVKTNYCIEALHISTFFGCPCFTALHQIPPRNVVAINRYGDGEFNIDKPLDNHVDFPANPNLMRKVYQISLTADGVRLERSPLNETLERVTIVGTENTNLRLVEMNGSGIPHVPNTEFQKELQAIKDSESFVMKYKRWLIGLNWMAVIKF